MTNEHIPARQVFDEYQDPYSVRYYKRPMQPYSPFVNRHDLKISLSNQLNIMCHLRDIFPIADLLRLILSDLLSLHVHCMWGIIAEDKIDQNRKAYLSKKGCIVSSFPVSPVLESRNLEGFIYCRNSRYMQTSFMTDAFVFSTDISSRLTAIMMQSELPCVKDLDFKNVNWI